MKDISIIFFLILALTHLNGQVFLEGKLDLDSSWAPMVYLSSIPDFEEMFTVAEDMIVASAPVNSKGQFEFKGDFLPSDLQFYRLHVSKKGDPAATIFIGGKQENHTFLFLSGTDRCLMQIEGKKTIWESKGWVSCQPNQLLYQVDQMVESYELSNTASLEMNRQFFKRRHNQRLRNFADTCSQSLVALYALYQANIDVHSKMDPGYYRRFNKKWEDQRNSYFTAFRSDLDLHEKSGPSQSFIAVAVLLAILLSLVTWLVYKKYGRSMSKDLPPKYAQLSTQERRIFSYLREGKSNKEISQILYIEPSTVKTHVRNIYSKLEINTRKEILNLKTTIYNSAVRI